MMDYIVIGAATVERLIKEVRVYCAEGWVPHGSLVVNPNINSKEAYLQPMTRNSEEK